MNKSEFIRETSVKLLAAYLVEDGVTRKEITRTSTEELVSEAIYASEILWNQLNKKGYCKE